MAITQLVPPERLARPRAARSEAPPRALDVEALGRALAAELEGEVAFDGTARALYASDASNYRRIPLGVVTPRSRDDLVRAVAVCRRFGAPVVLRGGGTALAGQTVNEAVVLDVSRHLDRVLAIDVEGRRARIELGLVCDDLVDVIRPHHLTFGPKPATHSRCCFGGMLANNCGGMQAQMNGTAVHNVEALDVLLYDGTRLSLGWMTERDLTARIARGGREGAIFEALRSLRDRYAERIRAGFPKLSRRVSGYNLDQLLPGPDGRFNLARILVGSEGTLAAMLEATVTLLPMPPVQAAVVLGFDDVYAAAEAVPGVNLEKPLQLEGMDDILHDHIQKKGGSHAEHLRLLSGGRGWLLVNVGGDSEADVRAKAEAVVKAAGAGLRDHRIYTGKREQAMLWDAREGALGSTAFIPGEPDTWPGWEDSAVRPEQLARYLRDLRALYDRYDYHPSLYGHFGMGLVHCRVPFDLYTEEGIATFRAFMSDAADLVVSYGGSLSGEHGDGQARAELLVKMFGPDLMQAMRELKAIFDPDDKMNPGKIVSPYPITDHLRLGPSYQPAHPATHFRYPDDEGSFARATLRCVGVGLCRREHGEGEHDVMCPSYMVTRDEKHSTRGRAHLLWEMMRGDGPIADGWQDEGVKESLELCLACKGCKGDCPVGVDVATYKAEFLSHYHETRRRPRHAYAFGFIDKWARLASLVPGLVNLVTHLPGLRAFAKWAAQIAPEATIPTFASATFRQRFARRRSAHVQGARKVVLWPDTFNDHFHPDTAMAAVRVLEAAGFEVVVPTERACCGRPLYDFGFLDQAKRYLERVLDVLRPHLEAGHPIVMLEPSCASVFRDELVNLMPDRPDAKKLEERTMLLSELLAREAPDFEVPRVAGKAIVQGHCHHKSVLRFGAERDVLGKTGLDAEVLESGCCGMAGAFGFAAATHDVAVACGERSMLPAVRQAAEETFVVADGFSCRQQIGQNTARVGLHLAEVLAMGLDGHGPEEGMPEARIRRARERDARRGMARAGVGLALVLGAAAWAFTAWRKRS